MSQKRTPKTIPGFGKSYALVLNDASVPVDTAVVFVHGFGGSPTGTWTFFQNLVDEYSPDYPSWTRCDMIFFSYDSRKTPIGDSANKLGDFLHDVLHSSALRPLLSTNVPPPKVENNGPFGRSGARYENLVLTGHSEGGVVIRRLVLNRFFQLKKEASERASAAGVTEQKYIQDVAETDLLLNARLRLFAPACLGTNFSSLLGFATSFSAFISAIAATSLVRNELREKSPILTPIQEGTIKASSQFKTIPALRAKNLFGKHDQVVFAAGYDEVDETTYEEGHDHFSICKPRYIYKKPLAFVPL